LSSESTRGTRSADSTLESRPTTDELREWHATMVLIREFERVCEKRAAVGKIPGGMHSAAGQEAVAVGSIRALEPADLITSSHRCHHHAIAAGLTPNEIMAELYGKVDGCLGGRGGHMHIADFSRHLYGSNGVVGGGLGIAVGLALGSKVRREAQVALAFFGDGGASLGRVWENVNLASLWKLPIVIVCENNLYAVETHISDAMAGESIAGRAAGFGLPCMTVDGQDVLEVYDAVRAARDRAAADEGPTFIEAQTYRYDGHNTGDQQRYRTAAEVDAWRLERDPIERLRKELIDHGALTPEDVVQIDEAAVGAVEEASLFADSSPWPDPATASAGVTA
jgi:TPP-dependent pyruvate/acetoin dehydrogenase alpha subunit